MKNDRTDIIRKKVSFISSIDENQKIVNYTNKTFLVNYHSSLSSVNKIILFNYYHKNGFSLNID